jgi:hypothetical protein
MDHVTMDSDFMRFVGGKVCRGGAKRRAGEQVGRPAGRQVVKEEARKVS